MAFAVAIVAGLGVALLLSFIWLLLLIA